MQVTGLQKILAALILIMIHALPVSAATNDPGLSHSLIMNQSTDSSKNVSLAINSEWLAGDLPKLTSASFTSERRNVPFINVREYFENIAAVSLLKDHDNAVWSLAPSFGKYSINPLNDLKNVQVLLRYRF